MHYQKFMSKENLGLKYSLEKNVIRKHSGEGMTEHLDRATGNSNKVLKYTFFMHICLVVGGLVANTSYSFLHYYTNNNACLCEYSET